MEHKPEIYKKNMQLIKSVFINAKGKIQKLSILICCLCVFYNTNTIS